MFPILEFDNDKEAIINPSDLYNKSADAEFCVILLSKDIFYKIYELEKTKLINTFKTGMSDHPLVEVDYNSKKIGVFLSGLGGPLSSALLEELIAYGYSKFIVCGSVGVLDKTIPTNKIIIPNSAIRDEGTSYHYISPSREIGCQHSTINIIEEVLKKHSIEYLIGKTWTTDAFYRETKSRITNRKSENCICVEMEAASLISVAKFRNVKLGFIFYSSDDISGDKWDIRKTNRLTAKEKLLWLSIEACSSL